MKLAMVFVCLAAIAAGLVHVRRTRTQLRNEIHRLHSQQIELRRDLWDQQVGLGWLLAPAEVRRRAEELAVPLVDKSRAPGRPVGGDAALRPVDR
ncbi:MAG TPA: hypothetical protein VNA25_00580 [Phycisphaerae bacterium]|nr:hypothetical protein [Phycisphaerae bacterium]